MSCSAIRVFFKFLIQKRRRQKTAAWLRERVLQLGPTFIKLGQLSSTRSDLFPREFVDELAKLQVRTNFCVGNFELLNEMIKTQ